MPLLMRFAAGVIAVLLLSAQVPPQAPVLALEGKIKQPQHWALADLRKMPSEHVEVSYLTERSPVTANFTGIRLWALIQAAGGIADSGRGAELRHAIRITTTDGWVVVTSTGELSPDFGDKPALIAFERDGKPLDDFRMVMPGDKHGGRNVRDIVTINIE